jgi:hypothetical protein
MKGGGTFGMMVNVKEVLCSDSSSNDTREVTV